MAVTIELPPIPASVAEARRWSRGVLEGSAASELVDTTVLLVSELVTNVVLHAQTPCSLSIASDEARIRVEVLDSCDRLPASIPPLSAVAPLAPSGRGLALVGGLSSAHGVDADPAGGKRVWFELHVPERA